jgi:hypothetical protein
MSVVAGILLALWFILPRGGKTTYLTDLPEIDFKGMGGYHSGLGKHGRQFNGTDAPFFTLNGRTYTKGLATPAPSTGTAEVRYRLDGKYRTFRCGVGLFDLMNVVNRPLFFEVIGDGRSLWRSGPVNVGTPPQECKDVDVRKVQILMLVVTSNDTNLAGRAVWLDPALTD